ncbi:CDP-alcohol phosphatidyltransferase family protein [Longibacter salinarum]|nr:CDP-alcohol phosphatidyltransferase family protein [Longibacter salinarum]
MTAWPEMEKPNFKDKKERARWGRKTRAYAVHVFTASGVIFAFLAMASIARTEVSPRWTFIWLAIAVLIDAADGPLARHWNVKLYAARIYGHVIDDIVDFLTFTFIPMMLVWRMGWFPGPDAVWVALVMMASLFGFSNATAKQEAAGFFLGFPSYWNVVAFYTGLFVAEYGETGAYFSLGATLVLALMTVLPVRFVYPNRAPKPWMWPVIVGAVIWLGMLVAMLPAFPNGPTWGGDWFLWASLVYPAFYFGLSFYLDWKGRRTIAAP